MQGPVMWRMCRVRRDKSEIGFLDWTCCPTIVSITIHGIDIDHRALDIEGKAG